MENKRIENGIKIIQYAVKNNMSLKKACAIFDYSPTYVKNVKLDLNRKENVDLNLKNRFFYEYEKYKDTQQPSLDLDEVQSSGDVRPQTKINQKGNTLNIDDKTTEKHIKTLDELLDFCEVDRELWEVKDKVVNKWDVTSMRGGHPQRRQNFQVKARLQRRENVHKERLLGDIFEEAIKNYKAPVLDVPRDVYDSNENNLLELSIFDLHLGKLGWEGETGENFDTKIASARFMEAINKLVHRASAHSFNRILFPVGNDFFNADNIFNTTTNGTPQDEDLRWQKTFKVGANLLVDAINLLKQTGKPVDVVVIPGNHDFERSFYLGSYLEAWFRDDSHVMIDNGASPRKYYQFGEVLLGFTHGKYEKESSLPMLMATEKASKKMWADTSYHEWHVGHIHGKRNVKYTVADKHMGLNEELGVTVRYLSSLTGTEEWHHKKGFVGKIKAADGFLWNDEDGLLVHINSNIKI